MGDEQDADGHGSILAAATAADGEYPLRPRRSNRLDMNQKQQKRSFVARAASGVWNALNFTRMLLLNLLVLLILALLLVALFSRRPGLDQRTTLVVAPRGELVEQFSSDPAGRALSRLMGEAPREVQLRDLLRAIDEAAGDDRIERLLIRPDRLRGGGIAALRDVRDALERFRASGKQVIAYANGMDQRQYLLASVADEVWLHPEGAVLLEGLARYRLYYREALQDRLRVDMHLFKVGEYKSAAEPYVLDGPSDEALQADLFWMGDLWQRYLTEVAAARQLEPELLQSAIDNTVPMLEAAGGRLSQLAIDQRLVDALMTEDQARAELISRGAEDRKGKTFRNVGLSRYLSFLGPAEPVLKTRPTVAVVVAQGVITGGEQPPGTIGGDSTSALLRGAREDDNVRAVVLRVDSPGGEVFASEQIRREVELLREAGKPVVVSMGNLAASGGYWISMNADRIFASPSTITGSIGVFGLLPTVPRTLEAIGVRVGGAGTTALAGSFDPRRPLDPQLARLVQSVIENVYDDFVSKVAEAREQDAGAIEKVARGRVWSGAQALEFGLVDELGGLRDAVADAAARAELGEGAYVVRYVEKEMTPLAKFLTEMTRNTRLSAMLGDSGLLARVLPAAVLEQAARELDFLGQPASGPLPVRVISHCFCEL
jgi:protease IV